MKTKQFFLTVIGTCAIIAHAAATETVPAVVAEIAPAATISAAVIHSPLSASTVPSNLYDLGQELYMLEEAHIARESAQLAHTKVKNLELIEAFRYNTNWNRIEQRLEQYQSVAPILEQQQKIDREITEMQ